MELAKQQKSKILISTVLDQKSELDEKLEKAYAIVSGLIAGCSDREANNALNSYVCRGPAQHEEVQLGLFFSMIIDSHAAPKSYRDLTLVSREGMTTVITRTNQVIHEKWIKLLDMPRTQILWLSKELVKNGVAGSENVVFALLRQIAGGDVSPKNIWLAESVLDILVEHRSWIEKFPQLLANAVYTYLRVIEDHGAPQFHNLRQREVEFCVSALREKFTDCMQIGRDLVRLLQHTARIPETQSLWRDILNSPSSLSPSFTGVQQLMLTRTSRKFLVSRLTPDMENKLLFLTTKVKFGQQKRYQDWFQRQYLSTPESQSLRCDIIRYICAVIHPPNELLCSDIIPRWAVIGWLLTTCTSNVAASNAKLSLFYDWLFFDPEKESIMNIEPCILVMYHSMRPHPAITATLLDFMCRIMTHFCPSLSTQVRQGVFTSLHSILDKRVLQSLSPLFDNPKLDRELRTMIRENFTEFCSPEVKEEAASNNKDDNEIELETNNHMMSEVNNLDVAEFSDDEDDIPLGKLRNEWKFQPIKEPVKYQSVDITEHIEQLEGELKNLVVNYQNEKENEAHCEIMDKITETILQEDFDQDTAETLSTCLCQLMLPHFNSHLFPAEVDEESLEDSVGTPLFVIFRNLRQTPEEDPSRQPLLMLLGEIYKKQPRIGYCLIYFLKVSKVNDEKMSTYKDFCKSLESKDLESCLMSDLRCCQDDDVRLFTFLLPDIYTQFPNMAIGNTDLLHLIVSSIDGTQLQDLVCQILQGHLIMFRKDSFLSVLNASLEWETLEQYFLWQLIAAHNIPVEHIMPILPKLEFTAHAEAMTSILLQLKQDCPTADLLRPVLLRECRKTDLFTVSILKHWAQEYEDRLADLLLASLTRFLNTPTRKRQRQQQQQASKKDNPSVEQILSHLDHMRQICKNISFLTHESIQTGLQQVQSTCTEAQKSRYSDLLALAEDLDEIKTTRVLRGRKSSVITVSPKSKSKKPIEVHEITDSSSDSSEDDEIKPRKKKKKTNAVEDDSD